MAITATPRSECEFYLLKGRMAKLIPWGFQENNLQKIEDFYSHGGRNLFLQQPTGTGKALVTSLFIYERYKSKKPVYWITHSRNLLKQASDSLYSLGINHGIYSAGFPRLNYRTQVMTVQSLNRNLSSLSEPEYIIVEEAHRTNSNMFMKSLDHWKNAKLFGSSATPRRTDGKSLDMYEELIISENIRWFIDNYYLSDYEYYAPIIIDMSKIHKRYGDYVKSEVEDLVDNRAIIGDIIDHYKKYGPNMPGIASCVSTRHADDVSLLFREAGYAMLSIHSKMPGDPLRAIGEARKNGNPLLSACDMIGEGTDIKGLTVLIGARPTDSLVVFLQYIGRVLRAVYAMGMPLDTKERRKAAMKAAGGKIAIILDFVANYTRHGLPDDKREWILEGRGTNRTTEPSTLKRCPQCYRPVPISARICECGYVFVTLNPRIPEQKEGELKKIENIIKEPTGWKSYDNQRLIKEIAVLAKTLGQARKIAIAHGMTPGKGYIIWTKILKRSV